MKKIFIILLATFLCGGINSCKKAGTDGNTTVVVFAKHHGMTIPNHVGYPDTVYVKFNSQEAASSLSDFDTYFVGEVGEDHIHCTNLHTGNYYLFVAGKDTTINQRVVGGMAIKIKHKDRNQEIDQDVAVTE
ncbi:MAG TPA: hypothetical protein VL651_16785 [Bacteroidia bacterium]|jgi:hypothetical protein|nr:hypothetical protein [Bacteroidia bacterium]